MTYFNVFTLFILMAATVTWAQVDSSQSPQGDSQNLQWWQHRQNNRALKKWTTCDTSGPKLLCHDCSTRLVCKEVGGLMIPCDPWKPHCNNGLCSKIPSSDCVTKN